MLSNGVQKDQKYENLLMEIIRIQRKLLDCRFIWNERRRMPAPKKRFWKRISEEELQYNTYLNELDELKEKARFHCREAGYSDGIQWWSLPWEQTEEYLIFDLEVLSDHDNWRFEQTWRPVAVNNAEVLTLREEGHCSLFSSQKVKGDQLISDYSQAEINAKMRNLNKAFSNYEMYELQPDKRRYIGAHGTYKSGEEYSKSSEYTLDKAAYISNYEQDLYQTKEITRLYAQSMSIHYDVTYAVAAYAVDQGRLIGLQPMSFEIVQKEGNLPDEAMQFYTLKDSTILLAAYLADASSVKEIPVSLLLPDIFKGAPTNEEARRQAEIFTCMAYKLVF